MQDWAMTGQVLNPSTVQPRPTSIFFGKDRGMALFLGFLVLTTIFLPMVTISRFGRLSLSLFFVVTLNSGAFATIRQTFTKYLVVGLSFATFTVSLAAEFTTHRLPILETSLRFTCLSVLLVVTLKRTLRPGRVTVYRVMGGIAGYLLIGFTWAFAYQLVVVLAPAAIHFGYPAAADLSSQPNDLLYFSFITLTTVGYGDVRPIHPVVRSIAVAEALVGQLYLAILIASLVGMALQTRSVREDVGPPLD
jgi:hypothetical protein